MDNQAPQFGPLADLPALDLRTPQWLGHCASLLPLLSCDALGLGITWSWAYQLNFLPAWSWVDQFVASMLACVLCFGLSGLYRCHDRTPRLLRIWAGLGVAFGGLLLLHFGWGLLPSLERKTFFTALALALVLLPGLRLLLSAILRPMWSYGLGRVPAYLVCSRERLTLLKPWLTKQEGRTLVGYEYSSGDAWLEVATRILRTGATEVILDNWPYADNLLFLWQNLCWKGVRLRVLQGDGVLWSQGAVPQFFQGQPILEFEPPALFQLRFGLKRALDILVAAVGLLLLLPLFAVVGLLILLSSPGPIFFTQMRVGVQGKLFKMYKFRSMYADAEKRRQELMGANEAKGPLFKIKNDPRITPLGRWLRRYSLDELPQLINVLAGEMSLVGPRPALPSEVAVYSPWDCQRLLVLPGITGLWQISGRSDIGFKDAVRCDLYYVQHWSLMLDLEILRRTLMVVLSKKGAY